MKTFNVTYEIVTPESAEHGDCEDCGFVAEGLGLREAIETVCATESSQCEQSAIECDSSPVSAQFPPRWITVYNGAAWDTGRAESRSLHLPDGVTGSSTIRIARLIGAYGV